MKLDRLIVFVTVILMPFSGFTQTTWKSEHIAITPDNHLVYNPDKEGNILPDFSKTGFGSGEIPVPDVPSIEIVEPGSGDHRILIQNAIDRVAARPLNNNGFRGAVLLKKGTYYVNGTLNITQSGIVIRGEGSGTGGTVVRETATTQLNLFNFAGAGSLSRQESTKTAINEDFVPTGRKFVFLSGTSGFKTGDSVLIFRPGTDNWIHDLKMDQIDAIEGTVQWTASAYNLYFERIITAIEGNKVYLDHPVVMQMDTKYGGGYLMKYTFKGRIRNCGIENLRMESAYQGDTDENHGWNAINFSKVNQGWSRNVVSVYFGMGCVTIDSNSRNISVLDSQCLDAKSVITGSRRYSFNCDGQLNLFKNCYTTEGRHDYVTGSKTLGPNVFTQCKARNTHADIGPHHRWACGTLYDVIDTDGEINVQDRGNWGTGHGWAGVTQVVWNCRSPHTAVQSPWVSGFNYCIGLTGGKYAGRFTNRPDGQWEGLNKPGLVPESLYEAQLKDRLTTGVQKNIHTNNETLIFPNPSDGRIQIRFTDDEFIFKLFNTEGRLVREGKMSGRSAQLDCSELESGTYLMKHISGTNKNTEKLIIRK